MNECELGADNCHVKADCVDKDAGFECVCMDGYNGDGTQCVRESDVRELFNCALNGALRGHNMEPTPRVWDDQDPSHLVECATACNATAGCLSFDYGRASNGEWRCFLGNGVVGTDAELYMRGPVPRAGQYYQYFVRSNGVSLLPSVRRGLTRLLCAASAGESGGRLRLRLRGGVHRPRTSRLQPRGVL